MGKPEKIYIGLSILVVLGSNLLHIPEPFFSYLWGEESRHFPASRLVYFAALSIFLGIFGFIWIALRIALREGLALKEDFIILTISILMSFTFIMSMYFKLAS